MLHLSLRHKIFLTLLVTSLVAVSATFLFMRWSFAQGFVRMVEARKEAQTQYLITQLAAEHAEEGGWQGYVTQPKRWGQLQKEGHELFHEPPPKPPGMEGKGHGKKKPPKFHRYALFNSDQQLIVGSGREVASMQLEPIRLDGKIVGYLGVMPLPKLSDAMDIQFFNKQTGAFAWIALMLAGVLAGVAWPLSNTLVRPIRRITSASEALAQGHYDTQLAITSRDELGQLAQSFNQLAQALNRTEQSRRLWMADVSHELRTPIALLQAELEAIQDDVRPLDKAAIESLLAETYRLNRLVDDLYQLSLSDIGALSYHKVTMELGPALQEAHEVMADEFKEKQIAQRLLLPPQPLRIYADPDRLAQLFSNLYTNALRYTNTGGELMVQLSMEDTHAVLDFQDSAPGVPVDEQVRLFERFYRGDSSRNRTTGGAGLGLAICKNIVEAHEGEIRVQSSPLGGLWVQIRLPLQ